MEALRTIGRAFDRGAVALARWTGLDKVFAKLGDPGKMIGIRATPLLIVGLAATLVITSVGGPSVPQAGDDGSFVDPVDVPTDDGAPTPTDAPATGTPGSGPGGAPGTIDPPPTGTRPTTPRGSACARGRVVRTGTAVQFPWAVQCVDPFRGSNGGATARGVYPDKIRVAYYITRDPVIIGATRSAGGCSDDACHREYLAAYIDWFKRYYQLYGRDVEVVYVTGGGRENDVTVAINDARRIAAIDPPVFAVLEGPDEAGAAFAEELASNGIMCFCTVSLPDEYYERHSPYVWGTLMSSTQAYVHRAEYIGQRLAGRKARWAGSDAMRARERSFGLVWFDNDRNDYKSGIDFFERELARYGVELARKVRYNNIEGCQTNATNIVNQLQSAEVTTVIFSGDPICPVSLTKAAQGQLATWEWFITGSVLTDTNNFGRLYDQTQWARAFGVSMLQPDVRNENEYWHKMYREVRPDGDEPAENAPVVLAPAILFFTGVHLAGPRLTPRAFKQGMGRAIATGGSVTLPRRSYGVKTVSGTRAFDHNSYDDMTEIWWDPDAVDPNGRRGAYWYVRGGKRYVWGTWPSTTPRAFSEKGATLGYDQPPDQ